MKPLFTHLLLLLSFHVNALHHSPFVQTATTDSVRHWHTLTSSDSASRGVYIKLIDWYVLQRNDSAGIFYQLLSERTDVDLLHPPVTTALKKSYDLRAYGMVSMADLDYFRTDFALALARLDSAVGLFRQSGNQSGLAYALQALGVVHRQQEDMETSLDCEQEAVALFTRLGDSAGLGIGLIQVAELYEKGYGPDTSEALYHRALGLIKRHGSDQQYAESLRNMGLFHFRRSDSETATKLLYDALRIEEAHQWSEARAHTLMALGMLYKQLGESERAWQFFKHVAELNQQVGSIEIEAKVYHFLAGIHQLNGEFETALDLYQRSLEVVQQHDLGDAVVAILQSNIGNTYESMGDIPKAVAYYERSLESGSGGLSPIYLLSRKVRLSHIYLKQGLLAKAHAGATEALNGSRILHFPKVEQQSNQLLSLIYEQQGDYERALTHHRAYLAIRDSVDADKTAKLLIEKEAGYQLQRKEQELVLHEQSIALLEKDKTIKRQLLVGLVAMLVLIVVGGGLGFYQYRKRKTAQSAIVRMELAQYVEKLDKLQSEVHVQLVERPSTPSGLHTTEDINQYLETALSKRELDVLSELIKGKTNNEIAAALYVSVNTVRSHLLKIYEKLQVSNRTQAVKKAANLSVLSHANGHDRAK